MIKHIRKLLLLVICFLISLSDKSWATTLTIDGEANLRFTLQENQVKIEGSYVISNKGDELAHNVFPLFELGSWKWAGEGKNLKPNASETWALNESLSLDKITCVSGGDCKALPPVSKGLFTIRVLRMYEDANGHPFSAPDFLQVFLGEVSGEERASLRVPSLTQSMECKGDGQHFVCTISIKNASSTKINVSVFGLTTRELEAKNSLQQYEIAPGTSTTVEFSLKNFNGLSGSTYPIFSILEWQDKGLLNSLVAQATLSIHEPEHSSLYLYLGIGAFVAVLALLYMFVLRKN